MKKNLINKALKEWSVIVDGLGEGKTIMIVRRFKPFSTKQFLLYPTFNYSLDKFQEKYKNFSKKSYQKKSDYIEIKYFAEVFDIIKVKDGIRYRLLKDYYLWKPEDVIRYDDSYIWLLKVFRLSKSLKIKYQRGMTFIRLSKYVSLKNKKQVLENKNFNKLVNSIRKILKNG